MIELLLLTVGGFLGSAHCVGMCGGFVVALGAGANGAADNLRRQVAFTAGRVGTYAFGGAVAGFLGWRLARDWSQVANVQAALALVAGVVLIAQGLHATGWWPHRWRGGTGMGCLLGGYFDLLSRPGLLPAFSAGVLTGFMPCGLVYGYLALAAASGAVGEGALRMILFGMGTAPLMILVGSGSNLLSLTSRRRALRVAAWCVVLTGAISLARGAGALPLQSESQKAHCVFCQ